MSAAGVALERAGGSDLSNLVSVPVNSSIGPHGTMWCLLIPRVGSVISFVQEIFSLEWIDALEIAVARVACTDMASRLTHTGR